MTAAPTLLAIETSTDACSVAIMQGALVQETFVVQPREHNRILLTMIDEIMGGLRLAYTDLDALAFGAGPGSFTGLRLAAGVVQGLAFSAEKPVIPVSSLAALALSAAAQHFPARDVTLAIVANAHMQDAYVGVYRCVARTHDTHRHTHDLHALADDALLPQLQLAEFLIRFDSAVIVSSGFNEQPPVLAAKNVIADVYPHAQSVLALARSAWEQGNIVSAEQALPVYLRDTVSWQKWQPKGTQAH